MATGQFPGQAGAQVRDLHAFRRGPILNQGLAVPEGNRQGTGIIQLFGQPSLVRAPVADPIERVTSKGVDEGLQRHIQSSN